MSGGVLIVLAGVWVTTQVLGGKALQRLGIVDGGPAGEALNIDPDTGVPNQDPDKPLLTTPGPLVGPGAGAPY